MPTEAHNSRFVMPLARRNCFGLLSHVYSLGPYKKGPRQIDEIGAQNTQDEIEHDHNGEPDRQRDQGPLRPEIPQHSPEQPPINRLGGKVVGLELGHSAVGSWSMPLRPAWTQRQNTHEPATIV